MLINRKQTNLISKLWVQVDRPILFCVFLLIFIGIILVITASPFVAVRIFATSPTFFITEHFINLAVALCVMCIITVFPKDKFLQLCLIGMGVSLFLMLIVICFGQEIKGARRWIYLLGFSLQPSEIAKSLFPICLSYIVYYCHKFKLPNRSIYARMFALYFVFASFLVLEPDIGTTTLISLVFLCMLVINRLQFKYLLLCSIVAVCAAFLSYFFLDHVQRRVDAFFNGDSNYQAKKAFEAIQSGEFLGKGVGQGIVKSFIPDAHTDFIFTVSLEEFGILFGVLILLLYIFIIFRSLSIALKSKNILVINATFGCCVTLAGQLFIHVFSNLLLIPTKGMTLPFISYGGSSLLSSAITMGALLCLTKKDIQSIILNVK